MEQQELNQAGEEKALEERRIYRSMLEYFINKIIQYDITNEEPVLFKKKLIIRIIENIRLYRLN